MKSFPKATHTYFKVINLTEQKKSFLSDAGRSNPTFKYSGHLDLSTLDARIKHLQSAGDSDVHLILQLFDLVRTSAILQSGVSSMDEVVSSFRKLNRDTYGKPRPAYVRAILQRIQGRVTEDNKRLWQEVGVLLPGGLSLSGSNPVPPVWPNGSVFSRIQSHGQAYMNALVMQADGTSTVDIMLGVMDKTGLANAGWKLKLLNDASPARVYHNGKQLIIGSQYRPRTGKAKFRIVAHELYGHALRGNGLGLRESEGFAILLEQLLDEQFKPRRAIRYLSAALAWGVTEEPLDFRQTFEIIWRLMVIWAHYDIESARSYAFDECVRIFRGGLPSVPGVVYLKDTVYFAANIEMWDWLSKANISYNEFQKIASGKQRILS